MKEKIFNLSFLKPRLPVDPAADTNHLTAEGKTKHKRVDTGQQGEKFWQSQQDHANDVIDPKIPLVTPPVKKDDGFWWEEKN